MSYVSNLGRQAGEKVTLRMQVVMWFSGMRGPLSCALAVTKGAQAHPWLAEYSRWTVPVNTTTIAITFLTNLLMAPLTGPLIRLLDLQQDHERRTGRSAQSSRATGTPRPSGTLTPIESPRHSGTYVSAASDGDAADAGALEEAVDDPPLKPAAGTDRRPHGAACRARRRLASVVVDGGARPDAAAAARGGLRPRMVLNAPPAAAHEDARPRRGAILRAWTLLDGAYLKPTFGGRFHEELEPDDDDDDE